MKADAPGSLAARVIAWFEQHGRRDLPWRHPRTPYRVWLSEIMLQQTQVQTVVPYFIAFTERFPSLPALAAADIDAVLHLWSGLGYYSRARNLHRAARLVVEQHEGELPDSVEALEALPGIGRSTAAAIVAQAWDRPAAILDGNVKRVLARYHAEPGWPGDSTVLRRLWTLAEAHLPTTRACDYTQAMMDLGATVCTRSRPACPACPLSEDCSARASDSQTRYPGSRPRRALPERQTTFLILIDDHNRLLLERRPPAGIWGGLWCFPELGGDDALADRLHSLGCCDPASAGETAPFTHTFTHFRLHISPQLLRVSHRTTSVKDDAHLLWYSANDSTRIGLPAPVARLLRKLQQDRLI